MSFEKAAKVIRECIDLCDQALAGETDPDMIKGLTRVREQLERAIGPIAAGRSAIPLDE